MLTQVERRKIHSQILIAHFILGYLTFGGFDKDEKSTDLVYLVDMATNNTCIHSKLPVKLKARLLILGLPWVC